MADNKLPGEGQEYVLGTGDEELIRLGFQHEVWSEYASRAWERAGFLPGHTLLDLGCGPGYATFDLARLVGSTGSVIAIDASERFIQYLNSQIKLRDVTNIVARLGDAEKLHLPEGSVDGAYVRWVLCFLRNPESVIQAVASALKPGASFIVQDYFNYRGIVVAPRSEIFERIFRAVDRSFRDSGGDPDVGSSLPGMMIRSGFQIKEMNPMVRIARSESALWKWPETFCKNYLPHLRESGFISRQDEEEFEREWQKRSNDPAAFFATPPMLEVIGIKK